MTLSALTSVADVYTCLSSAYNLLSPLFPSLLYSSAPQAKIHRERFIFSVFVLDHWTGWAGQVACQPFAKENILMAKWSSSLTDNTQEQTLSSQTRDTWKICPKSDRYPLKVLTNRSGYRSKNKRLISLVTTQGKYACPLRAPAAFNVF